MPNFNFVFGKPIRVDIPTELSDEAAFTTYLGLGPKELNKIRIYRERMYHHFSIAKKTDKIREISAPDSRLKFLQRKISEKLNEIYRPRNPVHGFVKNKSIKTNALSHIGRRHVLNLDLKNFFPSITQSRIEGMLISLGIEAAVTRMIGIICCCDKQLPQGAPSSPVLSNMICFRLDKELLKVAKEARCIYTRYADDITFSSYQPLTTLFDGTVPPPGHFPTELISENLLSKFQQNGFTLNPDKAHYSDRRSRRIVTGLKINEILNVDRRFVRNIRAALYSIESAGLENAEKKFFELNGKTSLASHLRGKIAFLTHIKGQSDPVVRGITLRFNNSFPDQSINVIPTNKERLHRSVWIIEDDENIVQGTAFFLEGIGLVTAEHCVTQSTELTIYHPQKPSNRFKAKAVKTCPFRDLALLEHEIPQTEFFELTHTATLSHQGEAVIAIGYPSYAPGDGINERPGTISSLKTRSGLKLVEVTQTLTPGMSGGPILNEDGQVIGVIHKGGPTEGRNFAIAINELCDWHKELSKA